MLKKHKIEKLTIISLFAITIVLSPVFISLKPVEGQTANNRKDNSPPDTQITSVVDGNGKPVQNGGTTTSNSIRFTFSGTDNTGAVSSFQCSIDSKPYSTCASGLAQSALTAGGHSFAVVSSDSSDNTDRSPAVFTWTVLEDTLAGQQAEDMKTKQETKSIAPQASRPVGTTGQSSSANSLLSSSRTADSSATNSITTQSTFSLDVNEGETATFQWECTAPDPQMQVTCQETSHPPGSSFTSTTGNPAAATFTWPNAGPPGVYTETVITHVTFCPPQYTSCPDSGASTLTIYVNGFPVADAGADQTVRSGETVTFHGEGSTDPDQDPLTYLWTQTAGLSVFLSGAAGVNPTFTAPPVTEQTTLTFQLRVSDGTVVSTDTVNVVVTPTDRLSEIEQTLRELIEVARAKAGWSVAAANLEHYLNGDGGVLNMDVSWLRGFGEILNAESTNQIRFENQLIQEARKLADGQTKQLPPDHWDRAIQGNLITSPELFYASGGSKLTSTGTFQLSRSGNTVTITGTVNHEWSDPYDWNTGAGTVIFGAGRFGIGDVKLDYISDNEARSLEEFGTAKSFNMEAGWSQSLTGTLELKGKSIKPFSTSFDWIGP